jgi:hypothetical protein
MSGGWAYIMTNRPNGVLYTASPPTSVDAPTNIAKGSCQDSPSGTGSSDSST